MAKDTPTIARIKKATFNLGWKHPFFLPAIARVKLLEDTSLPTAAARAGGCVLFNPEFASTLQDLPLAGVMAHELCHLLMAHHDRRGSRDAMLWNIATDQAINAGLRACGIELPKNALYPELPEHNAWCAEKLYDYLIQKNKDKKEQQNKEKQNSQSQDSDSQNSQGEQDQESSQGEQDQESSQGEGKPQGETQAPALQGCGVLDAPTEDQDQSDTWIATSYQAKALSAGTQSGAVLSRLFDTPPAKVKWEQVLRNGFAQAIAAHGKDDQTFRKRSRRSTIDGPQLPGWTALSPKIAVCIDSSGSVDDKALSTAISETIKACRVSNAKAYLVIHSHIVQFSGWIGPQSKQADIANKISDRGGTLFKPAYEAITQAGRCDVMIHLTDGVPCDHTGWPVKPSNIRRGIVALVGESTKAYIPETFQVIETTTN